MKIPNSHSFRSTWRSLAATLIVASLAIGCGGGGGGGGSIGSGIGIGGNSGVDTGGTGAAAPLSFSAGRIAGFGSIIVNGVRFDDATARVIDDDGVAHVRGELKLGMQTQVQAGPVTTDAAGVATAKATTIEFGSQVRGLVQVVDAAGATLVVLGQRIKVDAATLFDGFSGGIGSVATGNWVEVYAFFDYTTATYTATRIELKTSLVDYKVVGVVSALNTDAKTFVIGSATVGYANVPAVALQALANGVVVRVHLQKVQQGTTWIATTLASDAPAVPEGAQTEVEGFITDFAGAGRFKVGGVAVDASAPGVVFKSGSAAQLANGVRVEIEGTTRAGVLAVTRIDVKGSGGGDNQQFELHGAIESVNLSAQSFVLRGTTVTYDSGTRFDDGTAASLVVGALVEVKGVLSPAGNQLVAARIKFEH